MSRMREEDTLRDPTDKRIKRKYHELYANEMDNFDENDTFLERPKIQKLTKEMDNSIVKEMKFLVENPPSKKTPSRDIFTGEFYQTFKKDRYQYYPNPSRK